MNNIEEILEKYGMVVEFEAYDKAVKELTNLFTKSNEEAYEQGARDFDEWLDTTYQIGVDADVFLTQKEEE